MNTSSKIWTFRLIASGVPILLGLVLIAAVLVRQERLVVEDGDVQLRAAPIYLQEPGDQAAKAGHRYVYDARLGWKNIPNWSSTTFGKQLTINSKNLRDREYPYEKPNGVRRILVLGDSFTWGYGVADEEIFTEVMEAELSREHSGSELSTPEFSKTSTPWEVINSGVSGWGTDQEFLFYKDEGRKYSPDIVVVAFYLGNDPKNCMSSPQYGLHKPVFVDVSLTMSNVPVPKPNDGIVSKPSRQNGRLSSLDRHSLAVRIIEELAKECRLNGSALVLMKFGVFQQPDLRSVQAADFDFRAKLERIIDQLHYLDLDKEFESRSLNRLALTEGVDDGHWNAFGHRKVADILREFLSQQSLLD